MRDWIGPHAADILSEATYAIANRHCEKTVDVDHPIIDANGNDPVFANTDGGAGTPWFLLCTNRTVKPIIDQERKAAEFVAKDALTDDNVFEVRMFRYGVDLGCNVGYGRPLGLIPNLLVVPPGLESAGRMLLNSEYGTGGITNEWKGTAELPVVPWLA